MERDTSNPEVMDGLMGHAMTSWHIGDEGMHVELDDGRMVIFSGMFVIAVYEPEEQRLH